MKKLLDFRHFVNINLFRGRIGRAGSDWGLTAETRRSLRDTELLVRWMSRWDGFSFGGARGWDDRGAGWRPGRSTGFHELHEKPLSLGLCAPRVRLLEVRAMSVMLPGR